MPPRTVARSRTHVPRWLTVRGDSSLPSRWQHPNPASVSLRLEGNQNRAWGLTTISGRWRPGVCGLGWLLGVEEGDDGEDALVGVEGGGDSELAEDAVDVFFYRALGYEEGLGDPGVGLARGHQRKYLSFS